MLRTADGTHAILAALELTKPTDVIVAATGGFTRAAMVGDLFAAMARTAGGTAIVTDGLARDSAGISGIGPPVFAGGVSPGSARGPDPAPLACPS